MLEGNAEWPPPAVHIGSDVTRPQWYLRRWRRWALAAGLALLLPACIAGYRTLRRADQAMTYVEHEVRAAVIAEVGFDQPRTQTADPAAPLPAGPRPLPAPARGLEVRSVEVRGDYAMVEVWTHTSSLPWLPTPYRQSRFYQETAQGWLPSASPDAFYLPRATLRVGRFTFIYGPRDAGAVLEAAQEVAAMDADLHAELGLPPTDTALTINVKLLPDLMFKMDPLELAHLSLGPVLYVPTPAMLALPAHISEGDALLQLVAGLLVRRTLDEALAGSDHICAWQSLTRGLQQWLLWEHSNLPSQTRYEVERLLEFKIARGTPPYLTWVAPDYNACSDESSVRELAGSYTNDSVAPAWVAYAMSTYGRDRLPVLLAGLRRYTTWDDLIPGVYGVSPAEFEAGWQAYMRNPH